MYYILLNELKKYEKKETILIFTDLGFYDKKLHKDHAIKSPFTCYDWQRSKIYKGISLKKIFPVKNLQLNN